MQVLRPAGTCRLLFLQMSHIEPQFPFWYLSSSSMQANLIILGCRSHGPRVRPREGEQSP